MARTIAFGKPIIGDEEKKAVCAVMDTGLLVHGPQIKEFEALFARFTGSPHAVGVANCTAGLHLCYFAMGIGAGHEVIVPAMTHTATAHAVELAGAKAVFVDAETKTGNIDIDQIEAAITPRTKAISIVHFLGMPADMVRINAIAKKHGLKVIEDCALAVGSYVDGTHCGLFGDAGSYSFYPVKHMTTAEGGMVTTRDAALAAKLHHVRAFGVDRHQTERTIPGEYDVTALGFNYRMSEVHAAIGIVQMGRLPGILSKRKANYDRITSGLRKIPEIELLESTGGRFQSSYYCQSIILNPALAAKRFEIIKDLKSQGVGTSIYYPKPVPHMSYYKGKYGHGETSFPNAARISYRSIALSVGPHLNEEDMDYTVDALKTAIGRNKV